MRGFWDNSPCSQPALHQPPPSAQPHSTGILLSHVPCASEFRDPCRTSGAQLRRSDALSGLPRCSTRSAPSAVRTKNRLAHLTDEERRTAISLADTLEA